jgi:hypothetical protein
MMLSVAITLMLRSYSECLYDERRYAECRYAECRFAECRGTNPFYLPVEYVAKVVCLVGLAQTSLDCNWFTFWRWRESRSCPFVLDVHAFTIVLLGTLTDRESSLQLTS